MNTTCDECSYERVFDLQVGNVRGDLSELKERVGRLETTLARGVLVLVANLVGIVMMLAEQLFSNWWKGETHVLERTVGSRERGS